MPETRTVLTVDGSPLSPGDLERVEQVAVEEALGGQTRVSVTVTMSTDARSEWTSPVDALVAPLKPFTVSLRRGERELMVDARSVAINWSFVPGGRSTLTVEGLDRSVELDRCDEQLVWDNKTDATIARAIFDKHHLRPDVDDRTPTGVDSDVYSPQQDGTDWSFLKELAERNGFDVYVESMQGVVTGVFRKVDVTATPAREDHLALGYGELGGSARAAVQLLSGQEVHVKRHVPGSAAVDVASDRGTGHAMGARSLGGVMLIKVDSSADTSVVDAQTTATAMAERSAFGASLDVTLTSPDAPLVRARRTVSVAGLGGALDGLWLVRSVQHTVTPGGHTQAVGLIRNALGRASAGSSLQSTGSAEAAGWALVGVSL